VDKISVFLFFLANFCSISTSRNEKEHYCIANSLFFQKTIAKVLGEIVFGEKFVTLCHSF
jgi:hypothetical protein